MSATRGSREFRAIGVLFATVLILLVFFEALNTPSASAQTLPAGFQESVVFSGLTEPTAIDFASDGRVFVAERSGLIKV
ncbi:MAG: hypothetical protein ACRD2L_20990, partial [Terriglobia bacterium]